MGIQDKRRSNDALTYGAQETYVFERKFANDVILVGINENETKPATLTGLASNLCAGTYTDDLGGLLQGVSLTVEAGATPEASCTASITLPPHSVSVWQRRANTNGSAVGAFEPPEGELGATVVLTGAHFGNSAGSVRLGSTNARAISWIDTQLKALGAIH